MGRMKRTPRIRLGGPKHSSKPNLVLPLSGGRYSRGAMRYLKSTGETRRQPFESLSMAHMRVLWSWR